MPRRSRRRVWRLSVDEIGSLIVLLQHKAARGLVPLWVEARHYKRARELLTRAKLYGHGDAARTGGAGASGQGRARRRG